MSVRPAAILAHLPSAIGLEGTTHAVGFATTTDYGMNVSRSDIDGAEQPTAVVAGVPDRDFNGDSTRCVEIDRRMLEKPLLGPLTGFIRRQERRAILVMKAIYRTLGTTVEPSAIATKRDQKPERCVLLVEGASVEGQRVDS